MLLFLLIAEDIQNQFNMLPQTITYKEQEGFLRKLSDTNTYVISSEDLLWDQMRVPPCILVEGLSENKLKFEFFKVFQREGLAITHCEYKNTDINASLIIYNFNHATLPKELTQV